MSFLISAIAPWTELCFKKWPTIARNTSGLSLATFWNSASSEDSDAHKDQRLRADPRQSDRQQKAGSGEDRAISEADARYAPHVAPSSRKPAIRRIEGHLTNDVDGHRGFGV
jgi:hypothetical protein